MIIDMINNIIGTPIWVGENTIYWANTYEMTLYVTAIGMFIYLVKRIMMIFDWGVKIFKLIKGKLGR